jgi:hypothetical protein
MIRKQKHRGMSAAQPIPDYWGVLVCVALVFSLCSCSSVATDLTAHGAARIPAESARYSLIFIIHGDGEYLFHDSQGEARKADYEALSASIEVAQQNPHADVYIFHQRPARFALFFIPLRNGEFRHFRGGKLITHDSYWWGDGISRFDAEARLYRKHGGRKAPEQTSILLYFGHGISEFEGSGYDASNPDRTLNVRGMAEGIKEFTGDTTKFDLLVLSTCFGGTPYTVAALSPYARRIIASPENLHLSYLDLRLLQRLDTYVQHDEFAQFTRYFARQAFHRLTKRVQAAVTVAVYDIEQTQRYLHQVDSLYQRKLTELEGHAPGAIEYVDCDEEPVYVLPGMTDGVYILFRSARFGRAKNKDSHSGWQCCRPVMQQIGSYP